jgi:hypothetical protein
VLVNDDVENIAVFSNRYQNTDVALLKKEFISRSLLLEA